MTTPSTVGVAIADLADPWTEIIELASIVEVNYLDKKRGKRFNVVVKEKPIEGGLSRLSRTRRSKGLRRQGSGLEEDDEATRTRTLEFQAADAEDASQWVKVLSAAVNERRAKAGREARQNRIEMGGPSSRQGSLSADADGAVQRRRGSLSASSADRPPPMMRPATLDATLKRRRTDDFEHTDGKVVVSGIPVYIDDGEAADVEEKKEESSSGASGVVELQRMVPKGTERARRRAVVTPFKRLLWARLLLWMEVKKSYEHTDAETPHEDLFEAVLDHYRRVGGFERQDLASLRSSPAASPRDGAPLSRRRAPSSAQLDSTASTRRLQQLQAPVREKGFFHKLSHRETKEEKSAELTLEVVEVVREEEAPSSPAAEAQQDNPSAFAATWKGGRKSKASRNVIDSSEVAEVAADLEESIRNGRFPTETGVFLRVAHRGLFSGKRLVQWLLARHVERNLLPVLLNEEDACTLATVLLQAGKLEEFPPLMLLPRKQMRIAEETGLLMNRKLDLERVYCSPAALVEGDLSLSSVFGLQQLDSVPFRHLDFWVEQMSRRDSGLPLRDVKKGLRSFQRCFNGTDAVLWLMNGSWHSPRAKKKGLFSPSSSHDKTPVVSSARQAKLLLAAMLNQGFFLNALDADDRSYADDAVYRINAETRVKGLVTRRSTPARTDEKHTPEEKRDDDVATAQQTYLSAVSLVHGLDAAFREWFFELPSDTALVSLLLRQVLGMPPLDAGLDEDAEEILAQHRTTLQGLALAHTSPTGALLVPALARADSVGLTLDLCWEILRKDSLELHICRNVLTCESCLRMDEQFTDFVTQGLCVTEESIDAYRAMLASILGALVDEEWSPIKPHALNQNVIRPRLWKAYFSVARHCCSPEAMEMALQDAFCLFLENSANSVTLTKLPGWQSWVCEFFAIAETTYQQCKFMAHNVLLRVLVWSLLRSSRFAHSFIETLLVLEQSAEAARLERVYMLFSGILASLANAHHQFPRHLYLSEVAYTNLLHLFRALLIFLGECPLFGRRRPPVVDDTWFFVDCALVSTRRDWGRQSLRQACPDLDRAFGLLSAVDESGSSTGFHKDPSFRYAWAANVAKKALGLVQVLKLNPEVVEEDISLEAEEKRAVAEFSGYVYMLRDIVELGTLMQLVQESDQALSHDEVDKTCRGFFSAKTPQKRQEFLTVLQSKESVLEEKARVQ